MRRYRAKKIFYVYEHWRPDKDVCFYVGKGNGRRAWRKESRNAHYSNISEKLARLGLRVDVRLVKDALSEGEAINLEIACIAFWRSKGIRLVNRTNGGDGISGFRHSNEYRARLAVDLTATLADPERGPLWRARSAAAVRTPGARAAQAATTAASWKDPEIHARRVTGLKKAAQRPEVKAWRTALMKQRMTDPVYLQKMTEISRRKRGPRPDNVERNRRMAAERRQKLESPLNGGKLGVGPRRRLQRA